MGFRKKIYVRKSNKGITHGIKKTVKYIFFKFKLSEIRNKIKEIFD